MKKKKYQPSRVEIITPVRIQVHYLVRPIKNRNDSFFYEGQVCELAHGGRQISIEAVGMKEVTFKDGKSFSGSEAVKQAIKRKIYDKGLNALGRQDRLGNCNWFTLVDTACEPARDMQFVISSYNEALKEAMNYFKD